MSGASNGGHHELQAPGDGFSGNQTQADDAGAKKGAVADSGLQWENLSFKVGDKMILDNIMNLEQEALQRLTEDRRLSGSLGEHVEEMLNSAGIYWDSLNEEYFNIDTFQAETYKRLAAEYATQANA